jgi:hypothetical protein
VEANYKIAKDISDKLQAGFKIVKKKLIEKEKRENGYLVISSKDGTAKKVLAKDL